MRLNGENITFAGGMLDRAQHLRQQAATLAQDSAARTLLLWHGKPLLQTTSGLELCWLEMGHPFLRHATDAPVFLGLINGAPRFAHDVSAWVDPHDDPEARAIFLDRSEQQNDELPEGAKFIDLRSCMADLSGDDAGDAATAKAILGWHETHRFCAKCGAPSVNAMGGWQRNCPSCNAAHFPRTDPVVIMLVTHGNDVLLGRSHHWPERMYSLLAGFVEPGESLETAVRREVAEETAVRCGTVRYLASQPWPFPASLMVGCHAEALGRELVLDPNELESALWVSRERMLAALAGLDNDILPARKGAIAQVLLQAWVEDRLDEID